MRKKLMLAGIAAAAAIALTACSGGDPMSSGSGDVGGEPGKIIVGSADFAESQLLATIYSRALQNAGIEVEEKLNIGSREVYLEALRDGSINLLPEYNGSLLNELDGEADSSDPAGIRAQLDELLAPEGIIVLDEAEAENTDTLVVVPDVAAEHGLVDISDLAPIAHELTLAGPAEWKSRFEGVPGLQEVYGLEFGEFKVLDAGGPLTLAALQNGQAQLGDMFSSDPAIAENDLVALVDDKGLFPPANILPVIREDAAGDNIGAIADDWLSEQGISGS